MISLSDSWLLDIADASRDARKNYQLQANENPTGTDRIDAGQCAQLITIIAR